MSDSRSGKQVFLRFDDARRVETVLAAIASQWDAPGDEVVIPDVTVEDARACERVALRLRGMVSRAEVSRVEDPKADVAKPEGAE